MLRLRRLCHLITDIFCYDTGNFSENDAFMIYILTFLSQIIFVFRMHASRNEDFKGREHFVLETEKVLQQLRHYSYCRMHVVRI